MRTHAMILGLAAALLGLLILSGCPAPPPEQSASPEPSSEPEPAATTEPVEEPDAGAMAKDDEEEADDSEYDMGEVPEHDAEHLISAFVPPEGSVPMTNQWPAAVWSAVGDGKLVVYAKHLSGYDPSTETGMFIVWCGPPWQYVEECEADGGYDSNDAANYLETLGVKSVEAEMYTGPGDKYAPAPGYEPWSAGAARCVAMLFEPENGKNLMKRLTIWANMEDGERVVIYRGATLCTCPKYPDGEADGDWVRVSGGSNYYKVDQWGLPGNTPVPDDES